MRRAECALLLLACGLAGLARPARAAVARFEVASVDSRSVVVKFLGAGNVTRFDMSVHIFDLDRLREFRRSELSTARYADQLFSFDGLSAGTWFAIRIQYRLVYRLDEGFSDFSTKQELILRTKDEAERNRAGLQKAEPAEPGPPDQFVQLEAIASDPFHVNVSMLLVFPLRSKVNTVIVPELKCELGVVKPPAQQLHSAAVQVAFDLRRLLARRRDPAQAAGCRSLCVYPFVRASIEGRAETFRAREWCGSLQEAYELVGTAPRPSHARTGPPGRLQLVAGVLLSLFLHFCRQ